MISICDPRITLNLIFFDEDAYKKNQSALYLLPDYRMRPLFFASVLLFDKLYTDPVIARGLESIIKKPFLDFFGSTIEKLSYSGFVDFNSRKLLSSLENQKLEKFHNLFNNYRNTQTELYKNIYDDIIYPPFELITISRMKNIPYFHSDMDDILESNKSSFTHNSINILDTLVDIEFPNISIANLDNLLEIREMKGVEEFRRIINAFIKEISMSGIYDKIEIIKKWNSVKDEANSYLLKEFSGQINHWEKIKLSLSMLLNIAGLIPGVSFATTAISALNNSREILDMKAKTEKAKEFSWLTFLYQLKKK
jgi:hypothetical protein